MNQLFPLPIYRFVKIAIENGGIAGKRIKNLTPWLIKTILFEPLRWIELGMYNKRIQEHAITKPPIFILGFYRSGTSYLHQLLTQDERLGYHSNFQMVLPEVMLLTEKTLAPAFEFICRSFRLRDSVHRVPLSFRFPGEEDVTMTTFLHAMGAQWGCFYPNKMLDYFRKYVLFEGLSADELEAWKLEYLFVLKKISLANYGKQLVLKSPPNTARMKHLLSLFPNAKFIFIHRNPFEVYASNKRFWKLTQRIYAVGKTASLDLNATILETYSQMTSTYLRDKSLVPQEQLTEIRYSDFIRDPLTVVREAYHALRLDDFNYCEKKMAAFVNRQQSFVALDHQLPADERKTVHEKLEPLITYWKYPVS